jgi:hypothetical protein
VIFFGQVPFDRNAGVKDQRARTSPLTQTRESRSARTISVESAKL